MATVDDPPITQEEADSKEIARLVAGREAGH